MATWYVLVFRVVFMSAVTTYSLVCMSHIAAGWVLRKRFMMAIRSPILLTMSGIIGVWASYLSIFLYLLGNVHASAEDFVIMHLLFTHTSTYIARGIRLLVMYDPTLRNRYGSYIKEAAVAKNILISFGVVEALVWPLGFALGVSRIAAIVVPFTIFDLLLSVGASLSLLAWLRATNDLFEMSSEIRSCCTCLLGALVAVVFFVTAPAYLHAYIAVVGIIIRFHFTLWISNVRPIRAVLGQRSGSEKNDVPWFPHVPLRRSPSKVVIDADKPRISSAATSRSSSGPDGGLVEILRFPPLLRIFQDYCRKALCSESLMFLLEVSDFRDSLNAIKAETDRDTHFKRFKAIVDKFVNTGAPFEVNIGSRTKAAVLDVADLDTFRNLPLSEMSEVLGPAANEVQKMLKDNLYDRFCATDEYKKIAGSVEDMVEES